MILPRVIYVLPYTRQLLVDDIAVGLAGLLLAIPGLVTDSLALLVLVGPLLRRLFGSASSAQRRSPPDPRQGPGTGDAPIEGEFRRLDDE